MLEFPAHIHVEKNALLAGYNTLHVGGPADWLIKITDPDMLMEVARLCWKENVRFLPLGSGTNVFFSDDGFHGVVGIIKFTRIVFREPDVIYAQAGAMLGDLVQHSVDNRLTGLEFTVGIPGTVGGAIYGNAGAYGRSIGECLRQATLFFPDKGEKKVDRNFFHFNYRHSILKETPGIVLDAEFQLQPGDRDKISERVQEIMKMRTAKLPGWDVKTAGSYFKNIKDKEGNATPAAFYLDAVDSKQTHVGDAAVYHKHANIFVNNGQASAQDILDLEKIFKDRVREKFGIQLEREVMYIA
jgi:UDP-N-acetylmuramate dehydrogenase